MAKKKKKKNNKKLKNNVGGKIPKVKRIAELRDYFLNY